MFHLLKLAVYALIGYALYEFVQGILEENRTATMAQSEHSHRGRTTARAGGRR